MIVSLTFGFCLGRVYTLTMLYNLNTCRTLWNQRADSTTNTSCGVEAGAVTTEVEVTVGCEYTSELSVLSDAGPSS